MQNPPYYLLLALLAVAAVSTALTGGVRVFAIRRKALVEPSERCSHTVPTPHGGGVAIAMTSLALAVVFSLLDWVPDIPMAAFVILGLTIAAIGVFDDIHHLSSKARLITHFVVALAGLAAIPNLPTLSLFGLYVDSSSAVILWPLMVLAWVWLINLYNFMDGIDGLAAIQALMLFAGMAFNFWYFGFPNWAWINAFMVAAVLGFTVFNWPPAKIFMGDGGSGYLGFVIGFFMLLSAGETKVSMWSWIILLTLFIADATTTLLVRFFTGQKILEPHRLHTYQKLSDRLGSHRPVTLIYGGVIAGVLFPASVLANRLPHSGPVVFAVLFALSSLVFFWQGCGRIEKN
ncbi:MAG: MraY family glycosyltransferase [Pseudomonadota bacterium]